MTVQLRLTSKELDALLSVLGYVEAGEEWFEANTSAEIAAYNRMARKARAADDLERKGRGR